MTTFSVIGPELIATAATKIGEVAITFPGGVDLGNDVWIITGAGAPTDGVTGAGTTGPGSLYTDRTASAGQALYLNTGTKAVPTWSGMIRA